MFGLKKKTKKAKPGDAADVIALELSRIRLLIEWAMMTHPSFEGIGLPPTDEEVEEALKQKYEHEPLEDEEARAGDAAIRILKARAKGNYTEIEDDPGKDWDIF